MINSNDNLLRDELRRQTHYAHKRAEKALGMQVLMGDGLTTEQYFLILNAWLSWSYSNESYIFNMLEDLKPIDIHKRTKVMLLENDMAQAVSYRNIEVYNVPQLELLNKYQALGAMYVIEGATLGGQIIVKRLRKIFGSQLTHHFFSGYAEQTYLTWNDFTEHLANCTVSSDQIQQVVEGAIKTFESIFLCLNNMTLIDPDQQ